jgi:hypothetical protein
MRWHGRHTGMIDPQDVDDLINEWNSWRNLDHRLINDGKPSKIDASVDLFLMEQNIDDLFRQMKLNKLANKDVTANYNELACLIKQYQERAYVNILRGEH